jgi:hypothetical protein
MRYLPIILSLFVFLAGCSKETDIKFCEGVTPEGKGVNCGKKFSTGELTALFSSEQPFGTETLTLQVIDEKREMQNSVEKRSLTVDPGAKQATTNLSFYNPGTYRVDVQKNEETISSGSVEIVLQ